MSAIDAAKRHFSALGRHRIEVPEWPADDGTPLVIHAAPMTLADKQKVARVGEREGHVAMLASVLILKAEDADGKKLFTLDDKHALINVVDSEVISGIVKKMMETPSVEDQEKN